MANEGNLVEATFGSGSNELPERRNRNWLEAYLRLTKNQESPEIFHLWSGISTIAGALSRSVWIDRTFYTLYPNLYVVLVATSAECKKSTAINFAANKFIQEIPKVNILRDKITPEGLLSRMSTGLDRNQLAEDGTIKKDGSVYIAADELSIFLSNVSYVAGLVELLTGLYGCPDVFPYTTRHSPITIHNACVNILGGSTPEWLARGMPEHNESGGFLGRFVFVVAHQAKRKIAWPFKEEGFDAVKLNLERDLKTISKLQGEFHVTDEAKEEYTYWYDDYEAEEDIRLKEYYARKPDLVLKLAMIFSVSTDNDMVIRPVHIKTAHRALESVEKDMLDAFVFLGATAESVMGKSVLKTLVNAGPKTKAEILKLCSYRLRKVQDLNEVLQILEQEEKIVRQVEKIEGSRQSVYRLTTAEERRRLSEGERRKKNIFKDIFE